MTWLTPLTGAILAAAVIPPLLLLYFLKLRRKSAPIACTLLWQRSVEDLRANAPFQRLRRNLLLLLQLLALLLLAAAVMQPQLRSERPQGGRTILLVDNSASMASRIDEEGATRLDEAKRRARERIEALYGGGLLSSSPGETMIVAFSDRAEIASRFSSSKQGLLEAIDRIRPTHGETRLEEALKLARAYTTNVNPDSDRPVSEPATLEVFSDGRIQDLDAQVLRGEEMIYHRIGRPGADNVAINAISVERPYDRPTAVEVFVALLNYNASPVTLDLQLSVDETAVGIVEREINAAQPDPATGVLVPGRTNVAFTPFEQARGAIIEVAVNRRDDLALDNVARVVVPPPKELRVGLVPPSSLFAKQVLEGLPLQRLELLTLDRFQDLAESGGLDRFDVVVFEGVAPPEGIMPPGRYLTLGPAPPISGLNDYGEADDQIVLDIRDEHPALRFVNLDNLRVGRCRLLQPADDVEVLVEGSRGPLVVGVSRGAMHLIHVAFEPRASTWPFLRSWVTFLFNAIDYLGHIGEGLTTQGFAVGDALTTRLPADARDVVLTLPDGAELELTPADPTMFAWGPIRETGVYQVEWDVPSSAEGGTRAFAVNLLSERESEVDPVGTLQVGSEAISEDSGAATGYRPLWPYALGLCLAILMLEWWVYHRRAYL